MIDQIIKISPLSGNYQMLDGGAMFGHVPRTIWSKWMQPNQNNQVKLACRCLLIQEKSRNILLETGIGAFFNPELRKRYGVEQEEHVLLKSLAQLGLTHYDIDIVILSHLHFDHAGGLLTKWEQGREHELLFPNAKYVVSRTAWDRACKPHVRDKASFIKELLGLLEQSSRIELIDKDKISFLGEQYIFHYTHGHTPGLLHTEICTAKERILFCSDLIPAIPWVHLPVTMGYDRSAEQLINEKKAFLLYAIKNSCILFYTHDPNVAFSGIEQDPLGKFIPINLL